MLKQASFQHDKLVLNHGVVLKATPLDIAMPTPTNFVSESNRKAHRCGAALACSRWKGVVLKHWWADALEAKIAQGVVVEDGAQSVAGETFAVRGPPSALGLYWMRQEK